MIINSSPIIDVRLAKQKILKIMLGSTLVWSKQGPQKLMAPVISIDANGVMTIYVRDINSQVIDIYANDEKIGEYTLPVNSLSQEQNQNSDKNNKKEDK